MFEESTSIDTRSPSKIAVLYYAMAMSLILLIHLSDVKYIVTIIKIYFCLALFYLILGPQFGEMGD